ncbi:hypothetical protein D3C87_737090 [compost metagenome]
MAKPPAPPRVHTSMRGVHINMEEMRAKNEQSVAVTGRGAQLRMNARGDTLANGGRIDRKREDIDADYHTQLNGNAKRVDVRAVEADTFETPQQVLERLRVEKQEAAPKPVAPKSNPVADVFETPAESGLEPPKNVLNKDRARRLTEKDD